MAATKTLRETEEFLDRDPSFRNVGGHVQENRNRKERAQNPPQQSKAGQGKSSAKNSSRKNTSSGGNRGGQSDSESDDDQKRRQGDADGGVATSRRKKGKQQAEEDLSQVPREQVPRDFNYGPSRLISEDQSVEYYQPVDWQDLPSMYIIDGYQPPISQEYRSLDSQAVSSNTYSNSSYVPPTQEYGSEYGSPASSQAPASGTSQHETRIRSKNIQKPRELFSQDAAQVLRMLVESRKSPEQLAEEQRELLKRVPEVLRKMKKKHQESQDTWEGMRGALVSNKRQRDRYYVDAPGKHRIDDRDEYELHEVKGSKSASARDVLDGVYRIWNVDSAEPRVEIVKTDELLKAGWHRESDHHYWWRYLAGSPSSANLFRYTERDDKVIFKVQIDGTLVGTWNPFKG